MTEIPTSGSLSRLFQSFVQEVQPRIRPLFLSTLAVLAWWALSPAPANARCNGAAHSNETNHSGVAFPSQPPGWTQGLSIEKKTLDDDDDPSIVGLWHVVLLNPDGVTNFDEGYDLWHSDGTEEFNDNAAPQPPNGAGSVCFGVYKKTGFRTYKLRHPFWIIDGNGALSGSGVFLEQVSLDPKGDAYTGTFEIKTFDLKGALTFDQKGDLKAERLSVD
jgi:hypothetical protein